MGNLALALPHRDGEFHNGCDLDADEMYTVIIVLVRVIAVAVAMLILLEIFSGAPMNTSVASERSFWMSGF